MTYKHRGGYQHIHKQLGQLQSFIESKLPLILIIGEKNSGKSNLLNNLTEKLSTHCKVLKANKQDLQSAQHLIEALKQKIKLPNNQKEQKSEQALEKIISYCKSQEKSFLLIIDDADQAKLSVLATLSHLSLLQEEKSAQLHIILAGKKKLIHKMQSLQTRPFAQIDLATLKANHIKQLNKNKNPLASMVKSKRRRFIVYLYLMNRYRRRRTQLGIMLFKNTPKLAITFSALLLVLSGATYNKRLLPGSNNLLAETPHNYYTISLAQNKSLAKIKQEQHLYQKLSTLAIHKNKRQQDFELDLGHFKNLGNANAYAHHIAQQLKNHHYQVKHITNPQHV
jgi:hypothetical protein